MARTFPPDIERHPEGSLVIEEIHPGFNEVYFVPPSEKLEEAGIDFDDPIDFKKLLLEVNIQDDYISMHPLNTLATHPCFLEPKYNKLRIIKLVGFLWEEIESENDVIGLLESLPSGFVKDFNYGLGLQKDYRFIISNLEQLEIAHLVVEK